MLPVAGYKTLHPEDESLGCLSLLITDIGCLSSTASCQNTHTGTRSQRGCPWRG